MEDRIVPDKFYFHKELFLAAKKLKTTKEQGEFLMAALALFFDGEERVLKGSPDLLFDGWRGRIEAAYESFLNGKNKGKSTNEESEQPEKKPKSKKGSGKGAKHTPIDTPTETPTEGAIYTPTETPIDTTIQTPTGSPLDSNKYEVISNKYKEEKEVVATQQQEKDSGISNGIPDFISFNPRESPYVQNPPTVDEMVTFAQASCIPNFTRELAQRMIDYYQSGGWTKKNGQVIRDWHPLIKQWASGETKQLSKEEERRARINEILEAGYRAYEEQWGPSDACIG